ncbi:MAG TPA: hypothetical protein VLC91_05145 [Spongiibacteraceae bacterium]|nr:hypothetical protein [Spongiibacteraceae bacterium]
MPKRHRLFTAVSTAATLLTTLLFASASHAELKGSYQLNKGKQKLDLYYIDDRHMRADLDQKSQIVMKGNEVWVLKKQGEQWLAMNADQVGMLLKAAQTKHPLPNLEPVTLRATERSESVAGFPGRIYQATSGEHTGEVTLSDNAQVLALTNGWRKLALKLSENLGAEQAAQLQQVLNTLPTQGMGGLLRQDDQLVLLAVDNKIKAADADFPADTKVIELPKFQLPDFN